MSDMTDVACDSRNLSYTREYMHGLEEQQIIQSFRRLTDDEKRRVLRLVDLLVCHPECEED
ncbi:MULTISPECIES: hypothetical protein [Pseudomonas syringae group]|uniref:Uncharacterized protein n=3 Tax=Pseudomonas syringae group TaxID=136849 RepID=F3G6N3_PSESJ|nr:MULTISPECIES: hypothetical protein [Pseudomonas syringae group]EGH42733.1 hypothetical protein PSYPI_10160 [Pseudomonas syringae pv. pisi str. 1704B]PYD24880.1 hypothetical protein DND67_27475 [Pseudomonas syringae pv. pisi]RML50655.1 hypothetical protein ALQ93_03070 [Pseudomonas syringae pv. pisi]RML59863.1 hypothetical protein ALQ92_101414 [Pseudomonas syringae pv. pisi]RMM26372.1 hypothetical protein ALQ82_01730 [Pseudomonas syringae pv. pisi]